jgi:flagellar biogenesis protein FliO
MNQVFSQRKRPLAWILSAAAVGAVLWGAGFSFQGNLSRGLEPLGGILFVMGLAFLLPWALKSLGNRLPQSSGLQGCLIEVKGAKPVGQGRTLLVVEVEGERFLLCSGKENVELLAKLSSVQKQTSTQQEEEL